MSGTTDSSTQRELQSRALELLEFPQVLERLANRVQFSLARELALSLRPAHTSDEVHMGQEETSEAVRFLGSGKDLDISSSKDVRHQVEAAALGSRLQGTDLRDVLDVLTVLGSQERLLAMNVGRGGKNNGLHISVQNHLLG